MICWILSRQAPMRKVQSVVYGDASYGGTKSPKYGGGHYESGEIPGSYREEVLYLPAEDIPLDPGVHYQKAVMTFKRST